MSPLPAGRMQRGFLGEAALRLARLLELDGLVSPGFDTGESITPVVLVGDATDPGMGSLRNRRFMVALRAGAGVMPALRVAPDAQQGVILDHLVISSSAPEIIAIAIHFTVSGGSTAVSTFLDRAGTAIEDVPGLISTTQAALGTIIGEFNVLAGDPVVIPLGFMLSPGANIQFRHGATTVVGFVRGRSF